jgi:hypothetical protein
MAIALLGLSSCAWLRPAKGLKACRYTFHTLTFASMDQNKTYWVVDMGVVNPNDRPVTLEKMSFALLHGLDTLVTGWNPAKRELAAAESTVLQTSLELPLTIIQRLPPSLLANTRAEFTLVGDAYLQTWIGEVHIPDALKKKIYVNMPEQVAKVRNMFLQKFFPWSGGAAPKQAVPQAPSTPPGQGPAGPMADEPL